VERLVKAKYQDNLEFLQWMYQYYQTIRGPSRGASATAGAESVALNGTTQAKVVSVAASSQPQESKGALPSKASRPPMSRLPTLKAGSSIPIPASVNTPADKENVASLSFSDPMSTPSGSRSLLSAQHSRQASAASSVSSVSAGTAGGTDSEGSSSINVMSTGHTTTASQRKGHAGTGGIVFMITFAMPRTDHHYPIAEPKSKVAAFPATPVRSAPSNMSASAMHIDMTHEKAGSVAQSRQPASSAAEAALTSTVPQTDSSPLSLLQEMQAFAADAAAMGVSEPKISALLHRAKQCEEKQALVSGDDQRFHYHM